MSVRSPPPPLAPRRALGRCVAAARGAAFWASVGLPLAYPPLLGALAVEAVDLSALVAIVIVNVAALVLGHGHRPTGQPGEATDATDESDDEHPTGANA